MTKLRHDRLRTPGGHLPPDTWGREDAKANEELAQIVEERRRQQVRTVALGSRVRVRNCATGVVAEYEIVDPGAIDAVAGRISALSPIGAALIGNEERQTVQVSAPNGVTVLQILEIS